MKTKILAEDSQILVCLKPAGLAVQSARPGEADMVSELKNYLAASQRSKSSSGSGGRLPYLGLVHRLSMLISRGCFRDSFTAFFVISLNVIRYTFFPLFFKFSASIRCQEIASPSRSGSVAR